MALAVGSQHPSGATGRPSGLPVCCSLASSYSKTPFGFVDLKEGQGGHGRNHPSPRWKALSPGVVDFYSDVGAGFQASVSGVGDVAVNKILPFIPMCMWRTK